MTASVTPQFLSAETANTSDSEAPTFTCPSGPAEPGSVILGVVSGNGQVAYLSPNIPVTRRMLQSLQSTEVPVENRMRFACSCLKARCVQWKQTEQSGRCGLIDHAVKTLDVTTGPDALPHCGIRHTCRWFAQHGRVACGACPEVIRRSGKQCGPLGE